MVCAPVRSIIPSLKLGDYLSVQAHNPCSISHLFSHHVLLDEAVLEIEKKSQCKCKLRLIIYSFNKKK